MKLLLLFFLTVSTGLILGQTTDSTNKQPNQTGKTYITPIPVLAANPAFGFIFGAAVSASKKLGDPKSTNMSNALITGTYSTKNQLMFTLKSIGYTNHNNYMLMGDIRIFFSSQPTFGLGTGPESSKLTSKEFEYDDNITKPIEGGQLMSFNLIRFHQTVMKKVKKNFYLGLGYHLDSYFKIDDQLLNLESDTLVITSHYAYSTKYGFDPEAYTISGLSINGIYDSRDNVNNPYTGRFAFLSFKYNPTLLGSSKGYSTLWAEYRDYFSLSNSNPKAVLALWLYGNVVTTGDAPYMGLPALGWDQMGKSGRAYPQGRFRGNSQLYGEIEARIPLPIKIKEKELFGVTAFVNATTISSKDNDIDLFKYVNPGYGVGFRFLLSEKARTNITMDYAWGSYGAGAFYLNLNEYF